MPAAYAHYNFGKKVYDKLDTDILKIIDCNMDYYNLGLYGPDILFYYRPYFRNKVNVLGCSIHSQNADIFFNRSKKVIINSDNHDAALSYTLGCICHFILDSRCHPYINKKITDSGLTHTKIEAEFEKEMIRGDGRDFKEIDLTEPIKPHSVNTCLISPFYCLAPAKIKEAIVSMKIFCSGFNKIYGKKIDILSRLMKINSYYEDAIGLFLSEKDEPLCTGSNKALHLLLDSSVTPAVSTINEYLGTLSSSNLPAAFDRCFD